MTDNAAPPGPTGEMISFAAEGRTLEGYLVRPAVMSGNAPGVLVIHEAFGLTEPIKAVAERFAAAGYVALAVDLFANQNRALCMARMMQGLFLNSLEHQGVRDTRTALGVLSDLPGVDSARLGAIGFCLGGSLAIALACTDHRVRAVAPYYGCQSPPAGSRAPRLPGGGQLPGKRLQQTRASAPLWRRNSCLGPGIRARHQGVSGRSPLVCHRRASV